MLMKTKNFFLIVATTMGLALTGEMMTSCANQDNPIDVPDVIVPPGTQTVDLSKLESNYVAKDGDVLTGTLDGSKQPYMISIAEGATVVLSNAIIKRDNTKNYSWAGITCLGDATIILDGENSVEGFDMNNPGILPGPEGTTLTIKGEGKLTASSRGAAGIGSGYNISCGNILIEGGDIIAMGGLGSAGIGCGDGYSGTSVCGDITITGGTVTATGEEYGAGIGSGYGENGTNVCGNITITGGTVTATGGGDGAGIGSGQYGTCGNITITGGTVFARGNDNGTGIGCGFGEDSFPSVCGDIIIESGEGFVSVTAIKGDSALRPIGRSIDYEGYNSCGKIMFNDIWTNSNDGDRFSYNPVEGNYNGLILTISSSDPDDPEKENDTWTLTPAY